MISLIKKMQTKFLFIILKKNYSCLKTKFCKMHSSPLLLKIFDFRENVK